MSEPRIQRRVEPTQHLYRGFRYVPAVKSDIRTSFAMLRPDLGQPLWDAYAEGRSDEREEWVREEV